MEWQQFCTHCQYICRYAASRHRQAMGQKTKSHIEITRPKAIEVYSKHMGGVDLTDFLISCYRHSLKHKRWYLRIFFHFMNETVVNIWIIWRWTLSHESNSMDLLALRSSLAKMLINLSWNLGNVRRGRSAAGVIPWLLCNPPIQASVRATVQPTVRFNLSAGHWPEKQPHKNSSGCTYILCPQNIYLCGCVNVVPETSIRRRPRIENAIEQKNMHSLSLFRE